jgi:hypothetical protein
LASPANSFQSDYELNLIAGTRDDIQSDEQSVLRDMRRGTGTLVSSAGVPRRYQNQNSSRGFYNPGPSAKSWPLANSSVSVFGGQVNLSTSCSLDGSNWPTGNCSMDFISSPNLTGTYTLCLQLTDAVGPGEFYSSGKRSDAWAHGERSERIYIKVNVENTPDVPRISQLPVRGRANEDHEIFYDIGGWDPKLQPAFSSLVPSQVLQGGGSFGDLVYSDGLATVRPGYFDYDGSFAKYLLVDMNTFAGVYTGIGNSILRYNLDSNDYSYNDVCQSGVGTPGMPANICRIPCRADGYCQFRLISGDNFNGRVTMKYRVQTLETATGLVASTILSENTVAANAGNSAYLPFENVNEYVNSNLRCLVQTAYKTEDWRLPTEESAHNSLKIPGLFYDTLHPVTNPGYAQLNPPNTSRLVSNLSGLGRTSNRTIGLVRNIAGTLLKWPVSVPGDPDELGDAPVSVISETTGSISSANVFSSTLSTFAPITCTSALQEGKIVADWMTVPDKPFGLNVARNFSEDVNGQGFYIGSNTLSTENGVTDGDGDAPKRIFILNNITASVGTISLSATPPGTPQGLALLPYDAGVGKYYIPTAASLGDPGCQTALKRCLVYYHPASNYAESFALQFAAETGVDNWISDFTAPGSVTMNVTPSNDHQLRWRVGILQQQAAIAST